MTPLEDPDYEPRHPPVGSRIPLVVQKWGAPSQMRWFARYGSALGRLPYDAWDRHYVSTDKHRGLCCHRCDEEIWYGDDCCCKASRP